MTQEPPQQPPYGGYQPPAGAGGGYGGGPMPGGYGQQPAGGPPPNYLVWAILSTIFCCLPLGVASIVFSSQVNSKWMASDFAGSQESSRKAKQWAIWSAIVGVIVNILLIGIYGAAIMRSVNSGV